MKLSILVLSVFFMSAGKSAFSQEFEVPVNYQLNSKDDYSKLEKDVINASKWLLATPFNEQPEKRKEVSSFIVKWVSGSPTVNVELNPTIFDFEKKNPGMMVIYMAASAKYVLENNYSSDMRSKHKAALNSMITVYRSGKGIRKDKKMEKLIRSTEDGKTDEWMAENLKVEGQH